MRIQVQFPAGGSSSFDCDPDEHILDAATRQGVDLPWRCGQGWDLFCAGKVLSGEWDNSDAARYFPEEYDRGWVLPCTAKPQSDLTFLACQNTAMRDDRRLHNLPATGGSGPDCAQYQGSDMADNYRFTPEEAKMIGDILGMDWETVPWTIEEFQKGLEIELEHGLHDPQTNITNDDPYMTGKIAWAHLKEIPDYFQRLAAMEEAAEHGDSPTQSYRRLANESLVTPGTFELLGRYLDQMIAQAQGELKELLEEFKAWVDKYSPVYGEVTYQESLADIEMMLRLAIKIVPLLAEPAANFVSIAELALVEIVGPLVVLLLLLVVVAAAVVVIGPLITVPVIAITPLLIAGVIVLGILAIILLPLALFLVALAAALLVITAIAAADAAVATGILIAKYIDTLSHRVLVPAIVGVLEDALDVVVRAQEGKLTAPEQKLAGIINKVVLHRPRTGHPRMVADAIQFGLALVSNSVESTLEIGGRILKSLRDAMPANAGLPWQIIESLLSDLLAQQQSLMPTPRLPAQ